MIRHDLLHIHLAEAAWQEIMAHALDAIYADAPGQNDGSTHRLCCPLRAERLQPNHQAPHPADGRPKPAQRRRPEIPIAYRLRTRGSYM